jgi:hypothetical protein
MKVIRLASSVAVAIALAVPARADDDTDFANQLHTYGIYGPPDYNAWLAKIMCDRLHKGVGANAFESSHFLAANLPKGTTQVQTWQFVAAATDYFCPDQTPALENVAAQGR